MSDSLGRGRSLAQPAFPDDDGAAVEGVHDVLAVIRDGIEDSRPAAVARLAPMRLLAAVVAVLDEADADGSDKSSHMAIVSMVNADGDKGLLAFTSIETLAAWNPDARPVPAAARAVAQAAIDDDAVAVVIDVAGPARTVLSGPPLHWLAGST